MSYQFCSHCKITHRRASRICRTVGCGNLTIIVNSKQMRTLAQRFYDCDFNVLASTLSVTTPTHENYQSVHLSVEFRERYDIDKVLPNLPDGWYATVDTFSLHNGIIYDNITELTCDFNYYDFGFSSLRDEITYEITKIQEWLCNDGHIAVLRLSGFWL